MFTSDPVEVQFGHWPASEETWPVVFAMSINPTLRPSDPLPLWRHLDQNERARSFHDWFGHCLNCGTRGHSIRNCLESFHNRSNALNPAVGTAVGDQTTWRDWQRRIHRYRIK